MGIASPVMVVTVGWRFIYFLTSGLAIVAWVFLLLFAPETRWKRSPSELGMLLSLVVQSMLTSTAGRSVHYIYPGEKRPRLDIATYGPRTKSTDYGFFQFGLQWKDAGLSITQMVRSIWSPIIIWGICMLSMQQAISTAMAQTGSSILLAKG